MGKMWRLFRIDFPSWSPSDWTDDGKKIAAWSGCFVSLVSLGLGAGLLVGWLCWS